MKICYIVIPCIWQIQSSSLIINAVSLQVKLGTLEQDEAEVEWVLRPYMNTAKKRQFLGE